MSQDRVTQPMAARLQAAGWKTPCYSYYDDDSPKASIGELRERLTVTDCRDYWYKTIRDRAAHQDLRPTDKYLMVECDYSTWLYTVTASADSLAEVWLFTQNKKGE